MDSQVNTSTTKYQQVTVDVPEERVAEFHALFGRFLARSAGLRGAGRRGHRRAVHGRGCSRRNEAPQRAIADEQVTPATEL